MQSAGNAEGRLQAASIAAEAKKQEIRAHLESRAPDLLALLDGLRDTFGDVRLRHLAVDGLEIGKPEPPGIVVVPYYGPAETKELLKKTRSKR